MIFPGIDTLTGEQFHFFQRDMAIAAGVHYQIILMILLCGIVVDQRADLHGKDFAAALFHFRNAFYCFLRFFIGVIDPCLILTANVMSLFVFYSGIYHMEICHQQCIQTYLLRIIFHPYCFPEACQAGAYGSVVGIFRAGAVGIAAFGIDHTGDGLHQLFNTPETSAGQVNNIFRLFGKIHGFLRSRVWSRRFGTACQACCRQKQQERPESTKNSFFICHRTSSFCIFRYGISFFCDSIIMQKLYNINMKSMK